MRLIFKKLTFVTCRRFSPACNVIGGIIGKRGELSFKSLRATTIDKGALAALPFLSRARI